MNHNGNALLAQSNRSLGPVQNQVSPTGTGQNQHYALGQSPPGHLILNTPNKNGINVAQQGMSPLQYQKLLQGSPAHLQYQQLLQGSPGMISSIPGSSPPTVDIQEEMKRLSEEGLEENISAEVFSLYKAKEVIPGAFTHPGDVVEASSLAAVPLPKPAYNLASSIPAELIEGGKLSSLQLEGIQYASQRHQTILPNGNRAGFFIGDAAGVGKGRQIAGIILDNYARGRTKHIWFSISADLKVDAQRDFHDIECHIKVIEGCQQLDRETRVFGLPSDFKSGVVFSTYATLVSSVQRGGSSFSSRQSRLQQLMDWCGRDQFDGCLIFDECHKAKNFIPGKEQNSTKVAMAVTSIQRMLPKARVVYCSATGVSDVKNMAFMERLGLWGEGAPFSSFDHFLENINKRGLGAAEMLAMEMKASGMYVSRGLSYKEAEFVTIEANLTEEQEKMYDIAAHLWNEVKTALETAVTRCNTSNPRVWTLFWSCHQRFFRQLCLGVKVPTIVKEAKKAIEDGYCVVVGLQTTGEASLDSEVSKGETLHDFVSTAREMLFRFIMQNFPTKNIPVPNEPMVDEEWCLKAKELLLTFTHQIDLPNCALDDIIDQLGGPSCVAEMTGRKARMVRDPTAGQGSKNSVTYEQRSGDSNDVDSLNVQERNAFMQGKKLVAIISDAASTGISLHADSRVANQRRRIHLTVELPWSADKAVQQMGRSHRSNQSSGPLYKLLTTNLGGERRFASAVAKRLQTLGALTQGDRRAAAGADMTEFNFDTVYGRNALKNMYNSILYRQLAPGVNLEKILQKDQSFDEFIIEMQESLVLMGVLETMNSHSIKDSYVKDVSKFLNRILGLKVKKQNMIFNYFYECLQATIATAKKEGKYNEGLLDISASSVDIIGQPTEVFKDANKSTPTRHVSLTIDRGMSWEMALERFNSLQGKRNGFYRSRYERFGRYLYLLATQKADKSHVFKVARPNTGVSNFDEDIGDLLTRYIPVPVEKAEKGWKELYEYSSNHCIHGSQCKHKDLCTVGSRKYQLDLLCGGIIPIMSILEQTLHVNASKFQFSKTVTNMRVVRIQLTNGERLIGLRYPAVLLPLVDDSLKQQKLMQKVQARLQLGQNGIEVDPSSIGQSADQPKQSIIEPEVEVIPKFLKKAMTPPNTLKNYFKRREDNGQKASESPPKSEEKETTVQSTPKETSQSSGDSDDCFIVEDGESTKKKRKKRRSERLNKRRKSNTRIEKKSDSEKENKESPSSSTIKDSSEETEKKVDIPLGESSLDVSQAVDSAAETPKGIVTANRVKKTKQTNIASMFAKQSVVKEKKLECPICSTVMPSKMSNKEFNDHIDECLLNA
ncbi:Protein FORGETTER 1 [Holothuria leucospilota]|uniref:Protein FORGETTER 1 n=1 Tax=Holothuria leucospilota TaxID=206669 RepID=A0A9Q1BPV0_HOLLE|nr:Protein FORGETTER 1 [Holothuria leucospilota]